MTDYIDDERILDPIDLDWQCPACHHVGMRSHRWRAHAGDCFCGCSMRIVRECLRCEAAFLVESGSWRYWTAGDT